jgi:hypothetical protein
MPETPVPFDVTQMVEQYVRNELRNAERFENSDPLDESGIVSLHLLASRIYASGFDAGTRVQNERDSRASQREIARLRKNLETTTGERP